MTMIFVRLACPPLTSAESTASHTRSGPSLNLMQKTSIWLRSYRSRTARRRSVITVLRVTSATRGTSKVFALNAWIVETTTCAVNACLLQLLESNIQLPTPSSLLSAQERRPDFTMPSFNAILPSPRTPWIGRAPDKGRRKQFVARRRCIVQMRQYTWGSLATCVLLATSLACASSVCSAMISISAALASTHQQRAPSIMLSMPSGPSPSLVTLKRTGAPDHNLRRPQKFTLMCGATVARRPSPVLGTSVLSVKIMTSAVTASPLRRSGYSTLCPTVSSPSTSPETKQNIMPLVLA